VVLLAVLAAALELRAATPDYAREERWAQEIAPQVVVGDPVWLRTRDRARVLALYTEPPAKARSAVIVVHGLGVHPDWNLIGALRAELAERGFATLSVQMPVLAADAPRDGYRDLFSAAGDRLDAAARWLRDKGYAKLGIVSHSMGAAMVDAALARSDGLSVDAWVPVGMLVDFAFTPRLPVLDVIAERDFPEAIAGAKARALRLPRDGCSRSLVIGNADHYFERAPRALVDAIGQFLETAFAGGCEQRSQSR
jgi:alpha/beta superfamily hydrolase